MNRKLLVLTICLIGVKLSLATELESEPTLQNVEEIVEIFPQDFQHRSEGSNLNYLPRNPIPRVSNWLQRIIYDSDIELPGSRSFNFLNRLSRSLNRRNPFASKPKYQAANPNGHPSQSQSQSQQLPVDLESDPEYLESYNDEELYAPSNSKKYPSSSGSSKGKHQYQNQYQSNAIPINWGEKTHYPNCGMDYTKFDQRCCWEEENYMRTQVKKEEEMGYVVDASSYYWDENRERCLKSVAETPMALMTDIEDQRVCKKRPDCMWFADSGTCQCNPEYVGKRVYRGSSYKIYQPRGRW